MKLDTQIVMFRRLSTLLLKFLRQTFVDAAIGTGFGTTYGLVFGIGEATGHAALWSILSTGMCFALCGAVAGVMGGAFGTMCGYAARGCSRDYPVDLTQPRFESIQRSSRSSERRSGIATNRVSHVFEQRNPSAAHAPLLNRS